MEKRTPIRLVAVTLIVILGQVSAAHAYITPQQAFGEGDFISSDSSSAPFDRTDPVYTPPNNRAADNEAALQQSQRNFQYSDIEDIDVHPAAQSDESPERNLLEDETQYQIHQDRMENADNDGVTIVLGADGSVLHSGAPRTGATGSETLLVLLLIVLAGASTMFYAYVRNRKFV